MTLSALLLTAWLLAAVPDHSAEFSAAAVAHYDSLLTGRAVSWQVEVKRCPAVYGSAVEILRVEEGRGIPRGTRLCWVAAMVDGRERRVPVTLMVRPVEWLPVARRDIAARESVGDSLVSWQMRESAKLGAARTPERGAIGNLRARVRIAAGEVLTMSRLEPIPEVTIGGAVTLVHSRGAMEIRMAGRALEDGYPGERILVVNTASSRRLRGTVGVGGLVYVE